MKKLRILVTNVQSSLSQTLLKSLSALNSYIEIVGLSNSKKAFPGINFCDFVEVYNPKDIDDFCSRAFEVCEKYSVKLIIPSLERDTISLKKQQAILPFVLCPDPNVSLIFLDKFLTWQHFSTHSITFCRTILPSSYCKSYFAEHIIAKPRRGFNSKGIIKNPPNPGGFSDDTYILQELLEGTELTTAFYITREGLLHSLISFEREFIGNRSLYSLTHQYDDQIRTIIQLLTESLPLVGSLNIQSFIVAGQVVPIEVNARFSSSNYIRSRFGFKDVAWAIKEYVLHEPLEVPQIDEKGSALSIRSDIIYPGISASEITQSSLFEI
jgi:carbamoyl-phosphate synthase large subunit